MQKTLILSTTLLSFILLTGFSVYGQNNPNAIVGKWMGLPKQNIIVDVYKDKGEFRGKIIWFNDSDDPLRPMNIRKDDNNPNKNLRNRKIIGMEVLKGLVYNAKSNRWENGNIYDASSGKDWNSSAWLKKDGILEVRGFWHFEFIGKTMAFKKVL